MQLKPKTFQYNARNLGQALTFEITALMTPCISLWQCCYIGCDTTPLTSPLCFYKANITSDWEAASSQCCPCAIAQLPVGGRTGSGMARPIQSVTALLRRVGFFKPSKVLNALKQYFWQSDTFLMTFTFQGSCWIHASSGNHSIFRNISGKTILQNHLNKKQIGN